MMPVLKDADRSEAFKHAADLRKFEISLFWQRSLFFWGFIAAALVAYAALARNTSQDVDGQVAIACFGLTGSVAWTLANRGSKYWQENWEKKLEEFELDLGMPLFTSRMDDPPFIWWGPWKYSVSRLAMALSDFSVALWLFLLARALSIPSVLPGKFWIPVLTLLYIGAIFRWARTGKK